MKKGQITQQNCTIKSQNSIQVFFSEKLQLFYVKEKDSHAPNNQFKSLITCNNTVFNEFLKFLEKFKPSESLTFYKSSDLENKLNEFLIKRAGNCKVLIDKVA
ncbi:hypothetical protein CXF68_01900 [Tenacibaculum sp. Bg11-29]|uniref:hypothetical protein n=1 Tax=Tenacibaculum sp. Bg11-29 TaxID=2058306 RepID=UPI000C322CFC|nr:hypothetical protein [Tenacibaculum sp. Bg11-29]PKH49516.1 hypothetical protein CXF68_01900 [Tenacibaculum sp. Bg11-29]